MNFSAIPSFILRFLFFYGSLSLLFFGCTNDQLPSPLSIRVQYYYHPPLSSNQVFENGLKWYFSYLGASLKPGQLNDALDWDNNTSNHLQIDFSKLGFPAHSLVALQRIITTIKNSATYQKKNSIDLGRLVMLTLNSSHHYYAITGAYPSFNKFKAAYNFEDSAIIALGNGESTVTSGNRVIFKTQDSIQDFLEMAFIAQEGTGTVQQGNFQVTEQEVFDFMGNGQPRFAIYDEDGHLKTAVPSSLGEAGKPAKCMWCHESKLQPNYVEVHPQSAAFNQLIQSKQLYLDNHRATLSSDLSYLLLQEHRFAELLYISFMEPNANRLAEEWNYSLSETLSLLQPYTTHTHSEYPQLGTLYHRSEIDHLNPIKPLMVPQSDHEASAYEPNF